MIKKHDFLRDLSNNRCVFCGGWCYEEDNRHDDVQHAQKGHNHGVGEHKNEPCPACITKKVE